MKLLYITLALLLLLVASSYVESVAKAPDPAPSAFCDGKCSVRCSRKGRLSRCMKYCLMCCKDCNCVPSGTFGNKDECPCYRDKVTSGPIKKSKCP